MADHEETPNTEHEPASTAPHLRVAPALDVFENDDEYLLRADLPGVAKDAIDVQFDRGTLSVVGHGERVDFARQVRLPERVDTEAIRAEYHDGVLELHVPKAAELRPRKIEIA